METIKKCTQQDLPHILNYIAGEPVFNLFISGDIENFGIDNETVDLYVSIMDNQWDCLILRYLDNYIVYSQNDQYAVEPVAAFLQTQKISCISGKESSVAPLAPFFKRFNLRITYLSRMDQVLPQSYTLPQGYIIRNLNAEDAIDVVTLYLLVDEFAESYRNREQDAADAIALNLKKGGMGFGVYHQNRLVAVAATTADTETSAMIIGVATHPRHRQRGLASIAVRGLCEASFQKGKSFLCLFYDNPEAGAIYRRLGFVEMGRYALLR